ncbi:MAG: deoxynucleoside kinase [Clostridiales bacterium]|jgi:dTMP kinase|nr:deoxynucleoside kinase [Clostridiales bacterium]
MIIVIEGIDGSGKQTQVDLLVNKLKKDNREDCVQRVTFPNYESSSSAVVKMYLNGEFGTDAMEVNPYAASSFYAVDRYATIARNREIFMSDYVIADRYSSSNMIHQAAKLQAGAERNEFWDWVIDFEHHLLGIPEPDLVFFMDIPPELTEILVDSREKKFEGGDIHEGDKQYMNSCYECAKMCSEKFGWITIKCVENGEILPPEVIHNSILKHIKL